MRTTGRSGRREGRSSSGICLSAAEQPSPRSRSGAQERAREDQSHAIKALDHHASPARSERVPPPPSGRGWVRHAVRIHPAPPAQGPGRVHRRRDRREADCGGGERAFVPPHGQALGRSGATGRPTCRRNPSAKARNAPEECVMTFEVTPEAWRDIEDIRGYIAIDSPRAADRFLRRCEETFAWLTAMPRAGRAWRGRAQRTSGIRVWTVAGFPNHLLFYRVRE